MPYFIDDAIADKDLKWFIMANNWPAYIQGWDGDEPAIVLGERTILLDSTTLRLTRVHLHR